jgi:hypothetical protein
MPVSSLPTRDRNAFAEVVLPTLFDPTAIGVKDCPNCLRTVS